MKFLVDAQLPRELARWLAGAGHNALHTLDLPAGNATSDDEISAVAVREGRVVVTKDADFVRAHVLRGRPERLLVISTGNISNAKLKTLLEPNLPAIVTAFGSGRYVELSCTALIVHS